MNARQTKLHRTIVLAATVIALGAVTGCHKKKSGVNPASLGPATTSTGEAPTATITADPMTIDQGQSVVLNWRTQNATNVTIDGIGQVNANGTQTVTPSTSTNFHLTAKGDGGAFAADRIVAQHFKECMRPAISTSQNLARKLIRQTKHFDIFEKIPKSSALFFGEVIHRLGRA